MSGEISEELRHYLELRARELEEQGFTPDDARREAERRFGDVAEIEAACERIQARRTRREERGGVMTGWRAEFMHALRGLSRTPVVTLAALATLALGVGANTAVFSVVRGVLLRPLPYPEPEALVALQETHAPDGAAWSVAPANYLDWRRAARSFESMSAYMRRSANLLEGESPSRVGVAVVSGSFFATLGVSAALGRTFDPALRVDPGLRQVVLSHGLWTRRFGGDRSIVGNTVRIDEGVYDVLGVAPARFDFPDGAALWIRAPAEAPDIPGYSGDITQVRTAWYFDVVARLAQGVTQGAAQAELDGIAAALAEAHPDANAGSGIAARPLHEDVVESSRSLLLMLLSAVALVLLAACANVANLSLVRAEGRRRDFAIRAALGADGGQLLRYVFTEGLILALAGGALGLGLAAVALPGVQALLPADLPRRTEIGLDGAVLTFTLMVSVAACFLFAAAPALMARRTRPARALVGRGDSGGRSGAWVRAGLVVAEVALGVVLAAGTGLVVRSVGAMATVEPGFRAEGLATVRVSFPEGVAMADEARRERWRRLRAAIAALPNVSAAGVGIATPTERGPQAGLNVVRGDPGVVDTEESVVWHPASPGYLEALGVPLLRGRTFDERDRADGVHVALVSEGLARRFFSAEEAIGQRVTIGLDAGHETVIEIVGVVGDTRNRGPAVEPTPVLYRPLAQAGGFGGGTMTVAAHGSGDPGALLRVLAAEIRRTDATAVVYGEAIGAQLGEGFFASHRFVLRLLGSFALLVVGLAAVGIYGVTAHAVGRRRRELGIRMAIGATRGRVWKSVFAGGLRLTFLGVGIGVALAALAGNALSSLLFQVPPGDPVTLAAVSLVLIIVGALALALPAGQAIRVDPAESIRAE